MPNEPHPPCSESFTLNCATASGSSVSAILIGSISRGAGAGHDQVIASTAQQPGQPLWLVQGPAVIQPECEIKMREAPTFLHDSASQSSGAKEQVEHTVPSL